MNRNDAVALVQQTLGYRTDLITSIITTMQLAQHQLEQEPGKPWFLISDDTALVTAASARTIAIPTGFLEEYEEGGLYYIPTTGDDTGKYLELDKDDYDVLTKNFRDEDDGPPQAYALIGNYLNVFPLPDAVYNLKLKAFMADTILDTNIENKWLQYAPLVVIGKTGNMLPSGILNQQSTNQFKLFEAQGRVALANQNEARMHANRNYQMGGPH